MKLTLDTNCLIALDEAEQDPNSPRREEAAAVRQLVQAHRDGKAEVAVIAISASERQKGDVPLKTFDDFEARLRRLGLEGLPVVIPMGYWDVGFWDHMLWTDEEMLALERSIHNILFPGIPFEWAAYCAATGMADVGPSNDRKWKNAKCDVQAYWSHAWNSRDVFVTSDMNFHAASKKPALLALRGGRIETPASAVAMLEAAAAK